MEFAQLAREFGIPLVILFAIGLFTWKELWPFIRQRIEQSHTDGLAQQQRYIETLERFANLVTTQREATMHALQQLTLRMEEVTRAVADLTKHLASLESRITQPPRAGVKSHEGRQP